MPAGMNRTHIRSSWVNTADIAKVLAMEGGMFRRLAVRKQQCSLMDAGGSIFQLTQDAGSEEELGAPNLVLLWLDAKVAQQLLAGLQNRLPLACNSTNLLEHITQPFCLAESDWERYTSPVTCTSSSPVLVCHWMCGQ